MRSTLVFVMVLVSSPALYAEDRGEKKEVKGWTIRGRVIDIDVPRDADEKRKSLGYLHVEDKDGEVLIDVRTTTLIEEGPEGKRKPVKFSEIKKGWMVQAVAAPIREPIYPPIVDVHRVLVVDRGGEKK